MSSKLTRTILIAACIGFLIVWVFEFRRTTLFESYWLLLVGLICLLSFQFIRLKASMQHGNASEIVDVKKKQASAKKTKK